MSKTDFELLYLCLSFEPVKNGLPKKVKDESLSQEDVVTRKLYHDYSLFKRGLHQNLVYLNPQYDSLTLFRKSQKADWEDSFLQESKKAIAVKQQIDATDKEINQMISIKSGKIPNAHHQDQAY